MVEVLERREVMRRGREALLKEERTEGGGDGAGKGLGPPKVMRKRIWTWAKEWAGWMALGPIWFGPLLKFFFFKIFWYYSISLLQDGKNTLFD